MNGNHIQLDSYSLLICSKYFNTKNDFINVICVCKKFKETTEKLRFNPIPINSLKLFPKIQTQYLYNENDIKIDAIDNYEIWYNVDYNDYLNYNNNQIKCHHVHYSNENVNQHGNSIPIGVNTLKFKWAQSITDKMITIPNYVTSIDSGCFYFMDTVESIIINAPLKLLPDGSFVECSSLTSVTLPSSLLSLGEHCFESCDNIETVTIPNLVTSIGSNCFQYCTSLKSIIIPPSINMLEDKTFNFCSSLTKVILPEKLISIGKDCFSECEQLTTITLPQTLKHIGNYCFSHCGLHEIEIPKSVIKIGVECFADCNLLTNITFQSNAKEFSFKVSYKDSILYKQFGILCNNVVFTEGDVENQLNGINKENGVCKFIIPNGVNKLFDCAFQYQDIIQSIIIPTTVTSIKMYCFDNCNKLTSLCILNSVKFIASGCFARCNNLQQLSLPLNENNKYSFKVKYNNYLILKQHNIDCEKIIYDENDYYNTTQTLPTDIPLIVDLNTTTTYLTISNNIISLKHNYLSKDITSITFPTTVTYLCNDCFKNYSKLQSITIPTTIKHIGKHLIDGCISLIQLNYDDDWNNIIVSYDDHLRFKSIGLLFNSIEYTKEDKIKYGNIIPSIIHSLHRSYYNRSNETIHIPTHITSLDSYMFSSIITVNFFYARLQNITIPTSITNIPKCCFLNCISLTHISLPTTLTKIEKKAFSNCISLTRIQIPTTIESIGAYGFKNCYSLTTIGISTKRIRIGEGCFKGCLLLSKE